MTTKTTLVQAKGQVTIPAEIREKLKLKQGDRVVFLETPKGFVIQPAEVVVNAALDTLGKDLKEAGLSLEQLLETGREIRGELLEEEYGLHDE